MRVIRVIVNSSQAFHFLVNFFKGPGLEKAQANPLSCSSPHHALPLCLPLFTCPRELTVPRDFSKQRLLLKMALMLAESSSLRTEVLTKLESSMSGSWKLERAQVYRAASISQVHLGTWVTWVTHYCVKILWTKLTRHEIQKCPISCNSSWHILTNSHRSTKTSSQEVRAYSAHDAHGQIAKHGPNWIRNANNEAVARPSYRRVLQHFCHQTG